MQYSLGYPNRSGSWALSTVAANAGTVTLGYGWSGQHSLYQAEAHLEAFIKRAGSYISLGTLVFQGLPGFFSLTGSTTVTVQAGDTFGLRVYGEHFK